MAHMDVGLIILKLVGSCNLACRYCSAHAPGRDMSFLDRNLALEFFDEILRTCRFHQGKVTVLLHGGEPTLYPEAWIDALLASFAARAARAKVELSFTMQTNGICLDDSWIKRIHQWSIGVGISLDGPAFINDQRRVFADGRGSYEKVMETVGLLRAADVLPSVLSVIDERHLYHEAEYAEWALSLGLPVKMNPCFSPVGDGHQCFDVYFCLLKKVFERAIQVDFGSESHLSPIDDWFTSVIFDKRVASCSLSGDCAVHMLCLAPSGEMSLCGRLHDVASLTERYVPGTLKSCRETLIRKLQAQLVKRSERLGCMTCRHRELCHGGCAVYLCDGTESAWCAAASRYFDFIQTDGLRMLKASLLERKRRSKTCIAVAEELIREVSGGNR